MTAVYRIIQAYQDEERLDLDVQPSEALCPGREHCPSDKVDHLIVAAAIVDPFQSAKEIRDALKLNVSVGTIPELLQDGSLSGCVVMQKPYLISRQKEHRLALSCANEQWTSGER